MAIHKAHVSGVCLWQWCLVVRRSCGGGGCACDLLTTFAAYSSTCQPHPLPHPPITSAAFTVVTERLNAERKLFKERLAAAVTPLHALLGRHMEAFMQCADGWQLHGEFARAASASCTELTLLLPSREALPGGDAPATALLEAVHTACGALMRGQPLSGGA